MSVNFNMPKAGLTMVEGTISEWLVNEGDTVKKGDTVLYYENEKTVIDCECTASGIIHIITEPGDTVKVGEPMAIICESREEYEELLKSGPAAADEPQAKAEEDKPQSAAQTEAPATASAAPASDRTRVRASGLARKIAANEGVDLHSVSGTGPNGRIVAKDVKEFIESPKPAAAAAPAAKADEGEIIKIPMSSARRAIANNLRNSISTMVQASSSTEFDVTDLFELRQKLVAQKDRLGFKITINDLLVMATVKVLKKHPLLNATFDGEVVTSYPHVNINIAVGAESGLAIPVVKNCDLMTLTELSKALKDVADRARNGELKPGDQAGGYFTVSNVGMYPIDHGSPIANAPQVGLFAFGRTLDRVEMHNGEFVVRKKMYVMFTFDHRVFDGLEQGRIMSDLQLYLEHPELMLI